MPSQNLRESLLGVPGREVIPPNVGGLYPESERKEPEGEPIGVAGLELCRDCVASRSSL
jgi:hypothetical protein